MHLFINGLAASAGGGITYLRNVLGHLAKRPEVRATVLARNELRPEIEGAPNLLFLDAPQRLSVFERALYEQRGLRALVRRSGAQVLLSAGNIALRNSPVPQILLSRNALYISAAFYRDLRQRGEYRLLVDTWIKGQLAKKSIAWADRTVAPSHAFAGELSAWSGRNVLAIYHGFDAESFANETCHLPEFVKQKLEQARDAIRLLCVSHYNYYRNLDTTFRAIAHLSRHVKNRKIALLLTCTLDGRKDGDYSTVGARAIVRELGISDRVIELGPVPYQSLYELYHACNVYVSAAYAETFAHPLVEAMASGLPVIASDLKVHREICGDAAMYFSTWSSEELSQRISEVIESRELAARLAAEGRTRAQTFSWQLHVQELLTLAQELIDPHKQGSSNSSDSAALRQHL